MPGVFKRAQYFATQYVTGPQHLLLMLDLADERIDDPFVVATQTCPVYGRPSDDTVRSAVLDGTDEANRTFETNFHPLEIRFSYSGNDNSNCTLVRWAAFNIVKALAEDTVVTSS